VGTFQPRWAERFDRQIFLRLQKVD
jgi:hypothetical protein